tara:strand:+ start:928 stop:1662 length:735 start_codon:yes stop_codon:yes gene_type:complete
MKKTNKPFFVNVMTLFPEMFPGPLGFSIPGKARERGLWNLTTINIRDFASDKHSTVDDNPFGGGEGMVLRPDVIDSAIKSFYDRNHPLIYLSPRGRTFNQNVAKSLLKHDGISLVCGRYEGVDERVIKAWSMDEISMGDYVMSGGEPGAIALVDSIIRLIPGAVGSSQSLSNESFENGLLEYPLYTKPYNWNGLKVPDVLRSGNHREIDSWKQLESEKITKLRRPDLWNASLNRKESKEDYKNG